MLRHKSLLCDITEGRMLGKATRGRKRDKHLQMLSDIFIKTYKAAKREAGDRSRWQKRRHKEKREFTRGGQKVLSLTHLNER